jgi:hypothetical protein
LLPAPSGWFATLWLGGFAPLVCAIAMLTQLRRLFLPANYQDAENHHKSDGCNNTHDQGHIHRNFLLSAGAPANS